MQISSSGWPNSAIKKATALYSITSKHRISKATKKNYRELAARKVDVFLAGGNEPALRAALSAADGRPIAFLAVDFDPLAK
jgi:soluble P-type ATPase